MKYEVKIDNETIALDLEERDDRVRATAGARAYDLAVARPEEGIYLLFLGDSVYEARVSGDANSWRVTVRGEAFTAAVIDRKHRRASADQADSGQKQLVAPMPGKVVRLLRQAGEEIAAGEGVVIVEAMKMQNEIKAPKAGTLLDVLVREGDTVAANQVLALIE